MIINPYAPVSNFYCNDEYRIAYLKIHKCACSSIATLVANLKSDQYKTPLWSDDYHDKFDLVTKGKHPDELSDYFTFTFVRNPFDRFLSFYKNWILNPSKSIVSSKYVKFGLYEKMPFDECVKKFVKIRDRSQLEPHAMPMTNFVFDGNRLRVGFIGKLESVESDFGYIKKALGINLDLPLKNARRNTEMDELYTQELRELIYQYYRKDFEIFGYDFKSNHTSYKYGYSGFLRRKISKLLP